MPSEPSLNPRRIAEQQSSSSEPKTVDAVTSPYESTSVGGEELPQEIGPDWPLILGYQVTRMLARGGMGRVFAGRELSLEREVAIKTLLPGADADRFVTESRITARLPHPGIPPVYALGTLADGTPYLVMKLIRGQTLADLLRARSSPGEGLSRWVQVFEQIAQAVGFAHAQGIIHRDLKPANVMVGAFGEVQVMDWGLAKDLASRERERPEERLDNDDLVRTAAGTIMGTPGYMAPEQARGEPADARADVFALGSILTTILTGQPAIFGDVRQEVVARTAEADLADASGRLATSGVDAGLTTLARRCLAPKPEDRPVDAHAVAEEVASYRTGVDARLRQAESERAAALAREAEQRKRRRQLLLAAAAIATVLLAGIVGTTIGLIRAEAAAGAERVAKFAAQEANDKTQRRLDQIEKGIDLLASLLKGVNPRNEEKGGPTLYEQLRDRASQAADELDAESVGDPLAVARLQTILGTTLRELGDNSKAFVVLEKARRTRERELGAGHPETLNTLESLAAAYRAVGKTTEAIRLLEQVRAARVARLGPGHSSNLATLNYLALAYLDAGNLSEAIRLLEELPASGERKFGPEHPEMLATLNNRALAYLNAGKAPEAIRLLEHVRTAQETKLGPEHPDTLITITNLALAYKATGKLAEAIRLHEQVRAIQEAKLGPEHQDTLATLNNLAVAYKAAGKLPEAIRLYEQVRAAQETLLGPEHPRTLTTLSNLAAAYATVGKLAEAIQLHEQVCATSDTKLGRDHPFTLTALNNLAAAYWSAKRLDKSIAVFEDVLKRRQTKLGRDHPDTLRTMANLGVNYRDAGRLDEAIPLLEVAHRAGKAQTSLAWVGPALADAYVKAARAAEARPLLLEQLAIARPQLAPGSPQLAGVLAATGNQLLDLRLYSDAEQILRECLAIRTQAEPDVWATFNTHSLLGAALAGQKKYAEAEPLLLKGHEGMQKRSSTIPEQLRAVRLGEAVERLVQLYDALGKDNDAAKWRKLSGRPRDGQPP